MQPDNQFSPPSAPPQGPAEQPAASQPGVTGPQVAPATPSQSANTQKSKRFSLFGGKKFGLLAGIIAGVLLLGGGAAAFFVYQEQNKPENVLKKAIENAMEAKSSSFEGKMSFKQDSTTGIIDLKGQADVEKSAFQLEADVTVSGINVPVELRSVDKSIYFKLSNLDPVVSMVSGMAPEYAGIANQVADKADNQWIEVDETLLSQAGASCVLDADMSLTEDDRDLLFSAYEDNPFAEIKSTSDDTVNDSAAIKYEIEIDGSKAAEYGKVFKDLSLVKKLEECNESLEQSFDDTVDADSENASFTLWVDKSSKEISKIATSVNEDGSEMSFEMTFKYDEVNITKPEGARPVMEIFGELGALFNSSQITGGSDRTLGDFIEL